jgi:phytoene dehydrogenase-like protein
LIRNLGDYDAVVVGAGPNGLAAAITLSRAFKSVLLLEGRETIGGGVRSAELTLPHFIHDVCSAVQPLAIASPFFRQLELHRYGLCWIQPGIPLAHPFEDGTAIVLHRSLEVTGGVLGSDGQAYKDLLAPFVENHEKLFPDILAPLHFPRNPHLMGLFAMRGLSSVKNLVERKFRSARTRAFFCGLAAHAMIPLENAGTAAFAIVLATLGHSVGWPIVKGGSQKLADALADHFRNHGGEIVTGRAVTSFNDLPKADYYFFDVTPRQLLNIKGLELSENYRRRLGRFHYGPGVYKVDWALDRPIPWKAEICQKAGAVHLGNSLEEIDASIRHANTGKIFPSPYVILAQQSLFDPSRTPEGKHTAWAYCHVPHGFTGNITDLIETRIEQYAPGFREVILAKSSMSPAAMELYNPNYVGGDINGGLQDLYQLYARPSLSFSPYRTSRKNVYLCSSSTPPGGGVHGLCGYYAARDLSNQKQNS